MSNSIIVVQWFGLWPLKRKLMKISLGYLAQNFNDTSDFRIYFLKNVSMWRHLDTNLFRDIDVSNSIKRNQVIMNPTLK